MADQYLQTFDGEFPGTKPEGSEASMFIQWKGTNVCLDFVCACGGGGHLDDYFAYNVQCPNCGQIYQMGTQVIAKKVDPADVQGHSVQMLIGD